MSGVDCEMVFSLVQEGPRRGVFLSCVDVLKKTTPRIWRQWLANNVENSAGPSLETTDLSDERHCKRIVWVDSACNVGIRVHVKERQWRRNLPILVHRDEQQAASYSIELEGKLIGKCITETSRSNNA